MKKAIIRKYLEIRYKLATTTLLVSLAILVVGVLLHMLYVSEKSHNNSSLNNPNHYIEADFEAFCSLYFDNNSIIGEQIEKSIEHFNKNNCAIVIYKDEQLTYCSNNIYHSSEDILLNTHHNKRHHNSYYGERSVQLSKSRGKNIVVLVSDWAQHYRHYNKNWLVSELVIFSLIYVGFLLLIISLDTLISNYSRNRNQKIASIIVAYFATLAIIYFFNQIAVVNHISWLIGAQSLVFSKLLALSIRRKGDRCNPTIAENRVFRICYTAFMIAATYFLCSYTHFLLSKEHVDISIIEIAPIVALTIAYVNFIVAYNALIFTSNIKYYNLSYLIASVLIAIMATKQYSGATTIFLILSFATFFSISKFKWLTNIKTLYLYILLISLFSTTILYGFDTVSIFGEDLTLLSCSDKDLSLYSASLGEIKPHKGAFSMRLNHGVTIFIYVFLTSIGIAIIMINRQLYNVKIEGKSPTDKIWRTIYISLYVAIIAIILLGKSFAHNIREEFSKLYVDGISNSVATDYAHNNNSLHRWLEDIRKVYGVDIDVYYEDGRYLTCSNSGQHSNPLRPNQLSTKIVISIQNCSKVCYICNESYLNKINYITTYIPTDDGLILRIPYNYSFLRSHCSAIVAKFTNVFVMIIIIFIIFLTISYYKQIRPLQFIKMNILKIRSHDRINIPRNIKSNYEVSYLLNEYNNIINELLERHTLQMITERQVLFNRTMRMVAHEIKNPLTPMLMMSQLSLRKIQSDDPLREETIVRTLNIVIEHTNKISKLINKMMKESKNFSINSSSGSVISLLKEMVQFYSVYSEIKITIENQTPEITPETKINARDLWSVVSNITSNAIDAIRIKGSITGNVKYIISCDEKMMTLKIQNDGIPISNRDFKDIFKYNFTTKDDGNGIGLFLAGQIVKYAEGKIYISVSNDEYTEFVVELPINS